MTNLMRQIIEDHCMLNRTPANPDTDILVESLKKALPKSKILEFKSGTECLTWIMAKTWKVKTAKLNRINGETLIDFKDNPLHLWTHSIPFKGRISLEELKPHLNFNKTHPDWIPYHYRNQYNRNSHDWGFSISYNNYLKILALNETEFIVDIDTKLDDTGSVKVLDYKIKGKKPDTIFFAAHTCHPGIVTDGLSCVALLVELFKKLQERKLNYSYRLIIGPEYYAAAGFLSKLNKKELSTLKYGIFLDMIGNSKPFGFQTSFQGNSEIDKIIRNVFSHHVNPHVSKPFRKLWANDEMFYNGPSFHIPTVGIGCDRHDSYHFSADNMDNLDSKQLEECLIILEKIIEIFETNFTPIRKYRGPLCLSRHGLYIDPKIDQTGYDAIEHIQILMDGKSSCLDIAEKLGIDYFFVYEFCKKLAQKNLIKMQKFGFK